MATIDSPSPQLQALADQLPRSFVIPASCKKVWERMRQPRNAGSRNQTADIGERSRKRKRELSPITETRRKSLRISKRKLGKAQISEKPLLLERGSILDRMHDKIKEEPSPVLTLKRRSPRLSKSIMQPETTEESPKTSQPKINALHDEEEQEVVAILSKGREGRFVFYEVVFAGDADADAVWLKRSELKNCKGLIRKFENINKA